MWCALWLSQLNALRKLQGHNAEMALLMRWSWESGKAKRATRNHRSEWCKAQSCRKKVKERKRGKILQRNTDQPMHTRYYLRPRERNTGNNTVDLHGRHWGWVVSVLQPCSFSSVLSWLFQAFFHSK